MSQITMNVSLRLFQTDSLIRTREMNGGLILIPYYIGKLVASLIEVAFSKPSLLIPSNFLCVDCQLSKSVMLSIAFVCGYYSCVNSRGFFMQYLGIFFLLQLAVSGLSNFLSFLLHVSNYVCLNTYLKMQLSSYHLTTVLG